MPTVLELAKGTQKILPIAVKRIGDGKNKPIAPGQIKITEVTGKRVKEFKAKVNPSGRFPSRGNSVQLGKQGITFPGIYTATLVFRNSSNKDGPNPALAPPSVTKDRVRVKCNCAAYFFWFIQANHGRQAQEGARGPRYKRVTPDSGIAPKNPSMIPGMCKHLLYLTKVLKTRGFLQ